MDMSGERRIPAPRQKVWEALNDPEVLRGCIPGCESLEKTSDTDMRAVAAIKIGPMSGRFTGKVQLQDLNPPESYRISGEGQGGVLGFAKGGADVRLAEDGPSTVLSYDVKAQVGGKMAQLGARLVDATAKQMADAFFDRFTAAVSGPAEVAASGPAGAVAKLAEAVTGDGSGAHTSGAARPAPKPAALDLLSLIPQEPFGFPRVFWVGSAAFAVIMIMIFGPVLLGG